MACALINLQPAVLWRPIVGVYVVATALVFLLGLAFWTERARKLAISAAILPVALTVAFSLPQASSFVRICILYGTILLLTWQALPHLLTPDVCSLRRARAAAVSRHFNVVGHHQNAPILQVRLFHKLPHGMQPIKPSLSAGC